MGVAGGPQGEGGGGRPFWPTRQEARDFAWVAVMLAFLAFAYLVPLSAGWLLFRLRLTPDGDGWGLAAIRVVLLALAAGALWAWLAGCIRFARRAIEPRLPPRLREGHDRTPPPRGAWEALRANWYLAVAAAVGLVLATGLIRPDLPGLPEGAKLTGKGRGAIGLMLWYRDRPITARSVAAVAAAGCALLLATRLRAARRPAASGAGRRAAPEGEARP